MPFPAAPADQDRHFEPDKKYRFNTANNAWYIFGEFDRGPGVSIHDYDEAVGTGNAAVDDAAFAWLKANYPGQPWLLRAETDYNITVPVDISGIEGQAIIGGNANTTRIRQSDLTVPIVIFGGGARHHRLERFTAIYTNNATDPGAVAFRADGDTAFAVLDSVKSWYATRGIGMSGTTTRRMFSCDFRTVEVRGWSDFAIHLDGLAGSSGNSFTNVYLNNQDLGFLNATGVMYTSMLNDSAWDQLNIEACVVQGPHAVIFDECQGQSISSAHFEKIDLSNSSGGADSSLMQLTGFRVGADISGMRVHECTGVFAGGSSYFFMAPEARLSVSLIENYSSSKFDYIVNGPFFAGGTDTHIDISGFKETIGPTGVALAGVVGPKLSPEHLMRYNQTFYPEVYTTATLPTAKREGETVWLSDNKTRATWDGAQWVTGASTGTGTFTGDGTTAQFDLVHNLGKGAVAVALHNTTTNEVNPPGGPGITYVDDNTTRLTYATAPTAGHVYNWSAT